MSKSLTEREYTEAAMSYAKADSSDPFAFRRAMTHLRNGVASFANKEGQPAYYSAERYQEPRSIALPGGGTLEWMADTYRNRFRP